MSPFLALFCSLLFVSSCGEKNNQRFVVKYTGALHAIMSGNLKATTALDSLQSKPNFYALGALESLKGELQVFDGESFNSIVKDSSVIIDPTFERKAALIVYAQVPKWEIIPIPSDVKTKTALEEFIQKTAEEKGISKERPFPFLLEGKVPLLSWHVIDWSEGNMEHTHQNHKNAGLGGKLEDRRITVIGFFSLHHKGVFTHHTSNLHMHFKTENGVLAGHLDDLEVGNGMTLKLPAK